MLDCVDSDHIDQSASPELVDADFDSLETMIFQPTVSVGFVVQAPANHCLHTFAGSERTSC
jgi:hypothetical protein